MDRTYLKFVSSPATLMFEGEGGAGAGAGAATPPPPTTFTQEQLNTYLATERKKLTDSHTKKLEEMQKNYKLTDEERTALATQIEELKSAGMTKEEIAKRNYDKLQKESAEQLENARKESGSWKSKYDSSRIKTDLTTASVVAEAFNPDQILAILQNSARLVDNLGEDNKPDGTDSVKVKVKTKDAKGVPVVLDLSPLDAVKTLKEMSEFANLFKGTQVAGLGGSSGSGVEKGKLDPKNMTHEQYLKNRKELKK